MKNGVWLCYGFKGAATHFYSPYDDVATSGDHKEHMIRVSGVNWFTNLEIPKRNEELDLICRYSEEEYPSYDNYDAIEVSKTADIPSDYSGVMGVPITFLDKYCPTQFELLGITDRGNEYGIKTKEYTPMDSPKYGDLNRRGAIMVNGVLKSTYARVLIRNKHPHESC